MKAQEEEERVAVLAEHQVARSWGTWNLHGYPVERDLQHARLYYYGIREHLCQNTNKRKQSSKND